MTRKREALRLLLPCDSIRILRGSCWCSLSVDMNRANSPKRSRQLPGTATVNANAGHLATATQAPPTLERKVEQQIRVLAMHFVPDINPLQLSHLCSVAADEFFLHRGIDEHQRSQPRDITYDEHIVLQETVQIWSKDYSDPSAPVVVTLEHHHWSEALSEGHYVAIVTHRGIATALDYLESDPHTFNPISLRDTFYNAVRKAEQERGFPHPRTCAVLFVPHQRPIRPNLTFRSEDFLHTMKLLEHKMQAESAFSVSV